MSTKTARPESMASAANAGYAAMKQRWAYYPGTPSLHGLFEKKPDFRQGVRDIHTLFEALDEAERRAQDAERRAQQAESRLRERLNAFQLFTDEVARLASQKYSEACEAIREAA